MLINNAAVLVRRDFADLSLDDLERSWAVNLRAPVLLMQAARAALEQSAAPAIVNVISTAASDGGIDHVAAYAMTKAGLVTVSKSVAKEYGPLGIRVLCLSPPAIESQMRTNLTDEVRERARRRQPAAARRGREGGDARDALCRKPLCELRHGDDDRSDRDHLGAP